MGNPAGSRNAFLFLGDTQPFAIHAEGLDVRCHFWRSASADKPGISWLSERHPGQSRRRGDGSGIISPPLNAIFSHSVSSIRSALAATYCFMRVPPFLLLSCLRRLLCRLHLKCVYYSTSFRKLQAFFCGAKRKTLEKRRGTPADSAFSLLCCPLSPSPLPRWGRGKL